MCELRFAEAYNLVRFGGTEGRQKNHLPAMRITPLVKSLLISLEAIEFLCERAVRIICWQNNEFSL